ncbi:MAG: hypothetical protein A3F24_02515 [Candidatus Colwellbacteria bacterium RIFCSPHIGHO2_12_FULL_44_17]|uniref:DUF1189 domain-containing protein n=2 Tax=Candidatus Colwelliibacteriota TaxID=1817904 RepID=A0A1G1Z8Q1_9BACT|nr:MAG: hypothetical protein A3F24_02515 [Candidatus Colwellbacteria bacterium RIFCSPHIGHO2_12_FULL_44_17]OGY60809.1 MAG: hypothetical protein A3I31_02410 [Candidatus Colwellbacteria bacterium RIFCSPLOWO2_02_FULL_44_20b]
MKLFENIKNSVYGPLYYREVLSKPISYSFTYYSLFALVVAFLVTIVLSFVVVPKITLFTDALEEKAAEYFPANLEIVIKDGKALSNVAEPYFVKLPTELKEWGFLEKEETPIENLLVVNTQGVFEMDQFKSHKTLALLTGSTFAVYDENGNVSVIDLAKAPDFTFNKGKFTEFTTEIKPLLKVFPVLAVIGIFVFGLFAFALYLTYLLVAAFLIWLLLVLRKIPIGYGKSYQIGIHALTLPIILDLFVFFVIPEVKIRFLFTVILLLIVFFNVWPDKKEAH